MLTRSSPPRKTLKTFISEVTMPSLTLRITSKRAYMSLCCEWVQCIFACGLGLVHCENLNKGRITGPFVPVGVGEEAMSDARMLSLIVLVKMGRGVSMAKQSRNHNLCNAPVLRGAITSHDGSFIYFLSTEFSNAQLFKILELPSPRKTLQW